jgi:hypothetical protein
MLYPRMKLSLGVGVTSLVVLFVEGIDGCGCYSYFVITLNLTPGGPE